MLTSDLAHAAGVAVSTLRFYERQGLLDEPSRGPNGYRDYTDDDVRTVRFLRRGQELGFTLGELSSFQRMSAASRAGGAIAGEVAEHARAKIDEIDERIADLAATRDAIVSLLATQCLDPATPCPVVEALAARP